MLRKRLFRKVCGFYVLKIGAIGAMITDENTLRRIRAIDPTSSKAQTRLCKNQDYTQVRIGTAGTGPGEVFNIKFLHK
jgi:hypothetical protein